jgi:hypothetical protein
MRVHPHRHFAYLAAIVAAFVAVLALGVTPALAAHNVRPGAHGRANVLADFNAARPIVPAVAAATVPAVVRPGIVIRGQGRVSIRSGRVTLDGRNARSPVAGVVIAYGVILGLIVLLLSYVFISSRRTTADTAQAQAIAALPDATPSDAADAERPRKAA